MLTHIRDDEKEHVGEFLALLEIVDSRQTECVKQGKAELTKLLTRK
jgi:rubrerythrin